MTGAWDTLKSNVSSVFNWIKDKITSNWDSISSTLTAISAPIKSVIGFFKDLYDGISKWIGKVVDKITGAWDKAGNILNKLNPFSSFSISVDDNTEGPSLAPRSFAAPALTSPIAPMMAFAPTTFASGGILGDAMSKINDAFSGGGMLSGLPSLAGNALNSTAGVNVINHQPQEIKNEVTFHTVVRNDRDLDRTFEKADEWFAKRGQALNIGKGGSTRA
ncbi:hypothetical protein ACT7DH_27965 [Bacillus pacificus]